MADVEDVLQLVIDGCTPYDPPSVWAQTKEPRDFYRAPPDTAAFLATLQEHFALEDIYNSGAATGTCANLVLNPGLSDPSGMVAALRMAAGEKPFDLLTDRGLVASRRLPACATLEDCRYMSLPRNRKQQLCVAFSLDDMAMLTAGGLAATLATGLDSVGQGPLDVFCKSFGLDRGQANAGKRPNSRTKYASLVFVGWEPSLLSLAEPAGLNDVVTHFRGLEEYLEIGMDDVGIWKPTPADLTRLQFSLRFGRDSAVQEALLRSLDDSTSLITGPPPRAVDPTSEYLRALKDWNHAANEVLDRRKAEQAWRHLQQLHERDVILPFLAQAQCATDPIERSLAGAIVDVIRMLHPQMLVLATNSTNAIRKNGGQGIPLFPKDQFEQSMAMTDRLLALIQQFEPYRRKPVRPLSTNWASFAKRSPS